jgi:hypothetical protein
MHMKNTQERYTAVWMGQLIEVCIVSYNTFYTGYAGYCTRYHSSNFTALINPLELTNTLKRAMLPKIGAEPDERL